MVTFSILGWKGWEQFLSSPHFRTAEINYNQLNKFGDHCVNSIVVFIRHFSLLSHKSQNFKKKNLRNTETLLLVLFSLCINEHTQKKDNKAILWNNHSLWTKFHERFFVFEVHFYFFCSRTLLGNQRSRGTGTYCVVDCVSWSLAKSFLKAPEITAYLGPDTHWISIQNVTPDDKDCLQNPF